MIAALIPIKQFTRGKSRLSAHVQPDARARLAEGMFLTVLAAAQAAFDAVFVITGGADVAAVAEAHGARVVADPPDVRGLAAVVDAGLRATQAAGARTAVVLMADLPQVGASDLVALRALAERHAMVAAPDHRGCHTNALALTPPTLIATCFGHPQSLREHLRLGGPDAVVMHNRALSLDVDVEADLPHLPRM